MLSRKSPQVLFKKILFLFFCSVKLGWFPLICLLYHWSILLFNLIYFDSLLCFLICFLIIVFFSSYLFFFLKYSDCSLKFLLCSSILLRSVMIITLNILGRFLISISHSSFSELLSYSFVWNVFLCFPVLPGLLFYFCVLRRSIASLPFFKKWFYLFILAVLGSHCCSGSSLCFCVGFSLWCLLLLRNMGSKVCGL